jgi:hypothetical protein
VFRCSWPSDNCLREPCVAWTKRPIRCRYNGLALRFILLLHSRLNDYVTSDLRYEGLFVNYVTSELFGFCIFPVIIFAVLSGAAAPRIKGRFGSIPVGGAGRERQRHNRTVSSTTVTALAALFVASYMPE